MGKEDATKARAGVDMAVQEERKFAIDAVWLQEAFGRGGPTGEVTATYTDIGELRWHFVLGVALEDTYTVSAHELTPEGTTYGSHAEVAEHGVAWQRAYGEPFAVPRASDLVRFDGQSKPIKLTLPAQKSADTWGEYTLWRTAPVTPR